jgi:flavodoxin-like protein
MRAVVIYESMYGNTHQIAEAIGTGLAGAFDVAVVPVAEADQAVIAGADLLVVGGPTHMHGMARASTRRAAAKAADNPAGGLMLEPDALKTGLREWLDSLGKSKAHARAAAFDTRLGGPAAFTGRASKSVGKALRHHGYDLVAEPESFLVTKQDRLVPRERERAASWGARLAAVCADAGSITSVN